MLFRSVAAAGGGLVVIVAVDGGVAGAAPVLAAGRGEQKETASTAWASRAREAADGGEVRVGAVLAVVGRI